MSKMGAEYVGSTTQRAFELAAATALSLTLLPLDLPIMGMVAAEHRTLKPIYKDRRPLNGGKLRTLLKFKTVAETTDPEERKAIWPGAYHPDAPPASMWLRRKGLDEIPQLLAVITGSMNLIGIRPLPQSTRDYWQSVVPQETFSEWDEISRINTGLTGLDQLYGKQHDVHDPDLQSSESSAIINRRVELGIHGFHNACLVNDVRILAATPLILMFPELTSLPHLEEAPEVT
jgi:lipopolysaccharide/colanic/teichoic acid biosynthesis glycosyltransferase